MAKMKRRLFFILLGILLVSGALTPPGTDKQCFNSMKAFAQEDAKQFFDDGVKYIKQNELEKAVESFKKAIKVDPESAKAYFNLGIVYKHLGKEEEARKAFEKADLISREKSPILNEKIAKLLCNSDFAAKNPKLALKTPTIQNGSNEVAANKEVTQFVTAGYGFYIKGDYEQAIENYKKALDLQPNNANVITEIANIYYETGQYTEAEDHYELATSINPNNAEAYAKYASLKEFMGNNSKAIKLYEKAVELNPADEVSLISLANLYQTERQPKNAQEYYQKVIQLNPDNKTARLKLDSLQASTPNSTHETLSFSPNKSLLEAKEALKSKDFNTATELFKKILLLDPGNIDAQQGLSESYVLAAENLFEKGLDEYGLEILLKSIEASPNNPDALTMLGNYYLKNGDTQKALVYMERAAQFSFSKDTSYALAMLYVQIADYSAALRELEKVVKKDPYYKDTLNQLVKIYLTTGDTDKALPLLEKIERRNPNSYETQYNLASANYQLGKYKSAFSHYEKALKQKPTYDAFVGKGLSAMALDMDNEATDALEKAVKINTTEIDVLEKLAELYIKEQSYEKALPLLEKSIALNPKNPEILVSIADVSAKLGYEAKAYDYYLEAAEITPSYKYTLQAKSDLCLKAAQQFNQQSQYDKAYEALEMALASGIYSADAFSLHGTLLVNKKDFNRALESLILASDLDPLNADTFYQMHLAYAALGNSSKAEQSLQRAIKLNPDLKIVQAYPQAYPQQKLLEKPEPQKVDKIEITTYETDLIEPIKQNKAEPVTTFVPDSSLGYYPQQETNNSDVETLTESTPSVSVYTTKSDPGIQPYETTVLGEGALNTETTTIVEATPPPSQEQIYVELFQNGLKAETNGNLAQAYTYYLQAKNLFPNKVEANLKLAIVSAKTGNLDQAINTFENIIALGNATSDTYYNLATIYQKQGKMNLALQYYLKAIESNPKDIQTLDTLGKLYISNGLYGKAINVYYNLIQLDKDNHTYYYLLGISYMKEGFYDDAIRSLETALTMEPNKTAYLYNIGIAYIKKEERSKALKYFEKAINIKPNETEDLFSLASIYKELGKYDQSIKYYKKIIRSKEQEAYARYKLALVYKQKEDYKNMKAELREVIAISPNSPLAEKAKMLL